MAVVGGRGEAALVGGVEGGGDRRQRDRCRDPRSGLPHGHGRPPADHVDLQRELLGTPPGRAEPRDHPGHGDVRAAGLLVARSARDRRHGRLLHGVAADPTARRSGSIRRHRLRHRPGRCASRVWGSPAPCWKAARDRSPTPVTVGTGRAPATWARRTHTSPRSPTGPKQVRRIETCTCCRAVTCSR